MKDYRMLREQKLENAVRSLLAAIKEAQDAGCIDHLDCCDDGGDFWYNAIEAANESLGEPEEDPLSPFVGDNEFFIVGAGLEKGSSLNAFSQADADKKVKHHYGKKAKAEWRKYVG